MDFGSLGPLESYMIEYLISGDFLSFFLGMEVVNVRNNKLVWDLFHNDCFLVMLQVVVSRHWFAFSVWALWVFLTPSKLSFMLYFEKKFIIFFWFRRLFGQSLWLSSNLCSDHFDVLWEEKLANHLHIHCFMVHCEVLSKVFFKLQDFLSTLF